METVKAPQNASDLAAKARHVLAANDLGHMVKAGPNLYPHQWSWDSAFIAIGLAHSDVDRALKEFETIFGAQWSTGMLPHIIFSDEQGYFPGPDVWATDGASAKPAGVRTSSIGIPPVHATCLRRVLAIAHNRGDAVDDAEAAIAGWLDVLSANHDWLDRWRGNPAGLVEIHHGWASGMDNSPRFDAAYDAVEVPDPVDLSYRRDVSLVDASERPNDAEYQRYLRLVRELAQADFDDDAIARTLSFRVGDVFGTAVLALAAADLAALADELGRPDLAEKEQRRATDCRTAVAGAANPVTGMSRDFDVRTGQWSDAESLASFSLLVCGGPDNLVARQREILEGPAWMGFPGLRYPLPTSVSPLSDDFRPRAYWRGPTWPIMTWYLSHCAVQRSDTALAAQLRRNGLALLIDDGHLAEYYQALTGEPLGSMNQSWTAMTAIDWLAEGWDFDA